MATELDTALEQLGLSLAVRPEAFEAVRNAAETHENVFMGRGVALRLIAIMDAAKAATKAFTAIPTPATPILVGDAAATWLRSGTLLYTLEHDHWHKGKSIERNRLTVKVEGYHSSATEQEVDELTTRLLNFLSAPAALPLLGSGDAETLAELMVLARDMRAVGGAGSGASYASALMALQGRVASFGAAWDKALPALSAAASTGGGAALELDARAADLLSRKKPGTKWVVNGQAIIEHEPGTPPYTVVPAPMGDNDYAVNEDDLALIAALHNAALAAAPQHLVVAGEAAGQWVSVKERLPVPHRKVLVLIKPEVEAHDAIEIACFVKYGDINGMAPGHWSSWESLPFDDVIGWQELPFALL